jgi:hypothetical protein
VARGLHCLPRMATRFSLNRLARGFVVAAPLLVAACSFELGDSSMGDEGAARFEYVGWSCLFGCDMDQRLLAGTEQTISVTGPRADDAGVVAASTNPKVATFAVDRHCGCEQSNENGTTYTSPNESGACQPDFRLACDNMIKVRALTPGQAGLELHASDGTLIDRTTVRVAAAASVTLHGNEGTEIGDSMSMRQGDNMLVSARIVDAEGRELLADKGVTWTIDGGAVESGWCLLCDSDETELLAVAPGDATVAMRASGVGTSFVVRVVR